MGLIKGGNLDLDTHRGRTPCEQGTPKAARKPPEASGEAWTGFSLRASRRNQTCQHLHPAPAFGLFTLQSCETIFVARATDFVLLCYCSSRKQVQSLPGQSNPGFQGGRGRTALRSAGGFLAVGPSRVCALGRAPWALNGRS